MKWEKVQKDQTTETDSRTNRKSERTVSSKEAEF